MKTRRLPKTFYMLSIISGIVGGHFLGGFVGLISPRGHPVKPFGSALAGYGLAVFLLLLYRMWGVLQDGGVRTTPAKAVGFLLIPGFNLYWMFQAIWGWTRDYNNYACSRRLPVYVVREMAHSGSGSIKVVSETPSLLLCIQSILYVLVLVALLAPRGIRVPDVLGWPLAMLFLPLLGLSQIFCAILFISAGVDAVNNILYAATKDAGPQAAPGGARSG